MEFVTEQWPPLFKIDASAEVQALERTKPDTIYNVTFGTDLQKFVRESATRGLFEGRKVYGLLTGEPEYLDPLGAESPEGWFVTGYPWYAITDGPAKEFVDAYMEAYPDETPKVDSLVGYMAAKSIAAVITKAGSTDTDALLEAFKDLKVETPMGEITYRSLDHQSTIGAYVGTTALKAGKGVMVDRSYKDPDPLHAERLRNQEDAPGGLISDRLVRRLSRRRTVPLPARTERTLWVFLLRSS